jgi:putative nucleotidyltransferase with HDIG domain
MYRLSVVGDARARPDELARQVAGLFQIDFQLLQSVLKTSPGHHTLIDVDLDDEGQLLPLKGWLSRKPKGARIIFIADKVSRLHHARAYALGATAIVQRPVTPHILLTKLQDDGTTLASLAVPSDEDLPPGIAAAADALQGILSAASAGARIDPTALESASNAIVDQLEAKGLPSWIEIVRMHHSQTYQHCLLVTGVAAAFGEHIGLSRKDRQRLSFAGMLHDIGKARIPLAILEKPRALDEDEMALMRKHPEYGLEALGKDCDLPADMLDMVVHHHEFLDGTGYPHGLQGNEISDFVRIMTISDIFAALVERRSYKPPMSYSAAYEALLDMGPKLDKDLLRPFKFVCQAGNNAQADWRTCD